MMAVHELKILSEFIQPQLEGKRISKSERMTEIIKLETHWF